MNRDEMIKLAGAMRVYGGSFAKCIGEAILHADEINLIRLEIAFEELIVSYRRFLWTHNKKED